MSASQIDRAEMARHKAMLEDAYRFSGYIPDDLRQQLEETLNSEQRELVVRLQILAISFGRKLEAAARTNQVKLQPITQPQDILKLGETIKPTNPQEIMIVPAHAMPGKD